jgi:hypothetical protein
MEEVQFEAAHFDRKTRICFVAPQVFGANQKIPRGREISFLCGQKLDRQ